MAANDPSVRALGRKIAFHRARRGLSQRDFGALIDRSEAWVSQVERGLRRIDRMTVLRDVAEALEVPLGELAADTPVVAEASSRPPAAHPLRLLLSSSLSLSLAGAQAEPVDLAPLRPLVERAWQLSHAASYDELTPLLTELLPPLEAAARANTGRDRREAYRLLARTYHAAAAALGKLGELAAAWVAADRAITAAERAGDRLLMAEGAFRLVLVFQGTRQYDQAEHAAATAVDALADAVAAGQPEALSLHGALQLQLAVIAARQNRADIADEHLAEARSAAARLGRDRNDFNTEFGPTNVALHEVSVAVELGDAGAALRRAARVDPRGLSPERQGRFLMDVARAHIQRRHTTEALRALLDAETVTPEQVHSNRLILGLLHDLRRSTGGRDPQLQALIERCTAIPA